MKNPLYRRVADKLIIKNKAATSSDFGRYPEARPIAEHLRFGVINLDKPNI